MKLKKYSELTNDDLINASILPSGYTRDEWLWGFDEESQYYIPIQLVNMHEEAYTIIVANSANELQRLVRQKIDEGWVTNGNFQVVTKHIQNRYAGMQHKDSVFTVEYSQMITR
jgi:hypothetical protein